MALIGSRVRSVIFDDGSHKCFALVTKVLENGNLNLAYLVPDTAAWQIATDIPQGEGGRTWNS